MAEEQPEESFRAAMRALIDDRWKDVWKAIPVAIEGVDPEGVHDVRVASRRLRAAMDVAAVAFPQDWYKRLHRTAKEITSELGAVRDRDVQIAYLRTEKQHASPGDRVGIDRLIRRLQDEREAAREEMLAYLENLEVRGIEVETARRFGASRSDRTRKETGA